jgi:hypothetical protein
VILSVHQPQYLPWLGYFDKVEAADLFVFLDLPQYKKREFQNRNRIKGPNGEIWLTIPVLSKGKFEQSIKDVELDPTQDWQKSHWTSIEMSYKKTPFWQDYSFGLKPFYEKKWTHLNDLNTQMCIYFFSILGIKTPWKIESEIGTTTQSTERLIELCKKTGATEYLSGSGGKDYMDEALFKNENLGLSFQHYTHPNYRQQYPKTPFLPYMCILDLIFNEGPASLEILRNHSDAFSASGEKP